MPPILVIDPARRDRELAHARQAEEMERAWRRSWRRVYVECLGLVALGYVLYGLSWRATGDTAMLLGASGFVVAYALPFFWLVVFFLRHADQF